MRAREHGIVLGRLEPGPRNAITDVGGVRVGHATLNRGDGPRVIGVGPVRTGVTVIVPHDGDPFVEPVFAGSHCLNGNGEMTGLEWLRESGLLTSPVAITNTHSVGVVRDALVELGSRGRPHEETWSLPVVAETYDGVLNDSGGFHVHARHVEEALAAASAGPVAEGSVGGGTGMICHEFKGGIGTASRVVAAGTERWVLGVLVQANYGDRTLLRIDGVPVGEAIPTSQVPSPWDVVEEAERARLAATGGRAAPGSPAGAGSIIVILATDAPLLPGQCRRVAQRAGLGIARMGGIGSTGSGDLFLAFATGNRGLPGPAVLRAERPTIDLRMVDDTWMTPLFQAAVEATEEAIVNALLTAGSMTGCDGITAHGLEGERVAEILEMHGRPRRPAPAPAT